MTTMEPFVFLHTKELTETLLLRAISKSVPIEVDISFSETSDSIYVGHPIEWYRHFKTAVPVDLVSMGRLEEIFLEHAIHPVVFDVKDYRAIPMLIELIQRIKFRNVYFHVFAKDLVYDPAETEHEPHREKENIPSEHIQMLAALEGAKVIASTRGYTVHDENYVWLNHVLESLTESATVFNANMAVKDYESEVLHILQKHAMPALYHIDVEPVSDTTRYAATDNFETALRYAR